VGADRLERVHREEEVPESPEFDDKNSAGGHARRLQNATGAAHAR
jgi:hypothetical protein